MIQIKKLWFEVSFNFNYIIVMSGAKTNSRQIKSEMAIASSIIVLVGVLAVGAWFAKSDTLLGAVIQSGLAWCF